MLILISILISLILYDEYYESYYINKRNKLNKRNKRNNTINNNNVKQGYRHAKTHSINICALARDCGDSILNNKKIIEKIGKLFKSYKVILFENDSSDNTRDIIKQWEKENKNINLIRCKNNPECKLKTKRGYDYGQFSKKRINKMGYYREQYLDLVKKSDYKYTIVIDIDLDLNGLNLNQFAEVLSKHKIWNGVAINGRAFIPGTMGTITVPYDAIAFSLDKKINTNKNVTKNIISNYIKLFKVYNNKDLIKIGSAFNGLCLYKTKALKNSTYLNNGDIVCEHLTFHKNIDNFYAAPNWIYYMNYQKNGGGSVFKQGMNMFKSRS